MATNPYTAIMAGPGPSSTNPYAAITGAAPAAEMAPVSDDPSLGWNAFTSWDNFVQESVALHLPKTVADWTDIMTKGLSLGIFRGEDLPIVGKWIAETKTKSEDKSTVRQAADMAMEMSAGIPLGGGLSKIVTMPLAARAGLGPLATGIVEGMGATGIIGAAQTGAGLLRGEETPGSIALRMGLALPLGAAGGAIAGKIAQRGAAQELSLRTTAQQRIEEALGQQNAELMASPVAAKIGREAEALPLGEAKLAPFEETQAAIDARMAAGVTRSQAVAEARAVTEALPEPFTGGLPEHAAGTGRAFAPLGAIAGLEEDPDTGGYRINPQKAVLGMASVGGSVTGAVAMARKFADTRVVQKMANMFLPNAIKTQEWIAETRQEVGGRVLAKMKAARTANEMASLAPDEQEIASAYLTGKLTRGLEGPGQEVGQKIRAEIDDLSRQVRLEYGPESPALLGAIDANMGRYLRRLYLRDVLGTDYEPTPQALANARAYLSSNLVVQGRPATPPEVESAILGILEGGRGGQAIDLGIGKRSTRIDLSPTMKKQDIPEPIRELMGQIDNVGYLAGRTEGDLMEMLATSRFYKHVTAGKEPDGTAWFQPLDALGRPPTGYVQMPDTPRVGAARGMAVLEKYAPDVNELSMGPAAWQKIFTSIMSPWKVGKTILNPATHMRNVLGNFIFADFAGINPGNPANAPYYAKAFKTLVSPKEDALYNRAVASGAIGGEFAHEELGVLAQQLNGADTPIKGLIRMLSAPIKGLGKVYQGEDEIFKLATFLKQVERGATDTEAADHINHWYPNYREVGSAVKALRVVPGGAPFVSFSVEASRIYAQAMQEHPLKLMGWTMVYPAAMTAFALGQTGLDLNDWNTMRGQLPKALQSHYIVALPYRDEQGGLHAWDISYILPNGEMTRFDDTPGAIGPLSNFVLSDPLTSTLWQLKQNRSALGNREIAGPLDRGIDKWRKWGEFIYQQAMPSLAPPIPGAGIHGGFAFEALKKAEEGKRSRYGIRRDVGTEALDRLTPFGTIPMEAPEFKMQRVQQMQKDVRDAKQAWSRLVGDPDVDLSDKLKASQGFQDALKEAMTPGLRWLQQNPSDIPLRLMQGMPEVAP